MGYGGALIWTGLAKNLKKRFPQKEVVFVYGKSVKEMLFLKKNPDLVIYDNNPDIAKVVSAPLWYCTCFFINKKNLIVVDLRKKEYHYWSDDTKEKLIYRTDGHAISIACKPFGITSALLETALYTTTAEEGKVKNIMKEEIKTKSFICIEPNAKKTFTANKQWPLSYWEELSKMLLSYFSEHNLDYSIVQVGVEGSTVLPGVIDLTGRTSFRELKPLIEEASFVLCNEGGVAHLAAGTHTKAVVIANPSLPLQLMSYPQHLTIIAKEGAHNCGLRAQCPICQERLVSILPQTVFEQIVSLLK